MEKTDTTFSARQFKHLCLDYMRYVLWGFPVIIPAKVPGNLEVQKQLPLIVTEDLQEKDLEWLLNCQLIEPKDQCWPYEEILYNIYSIFLFFSSKNHTNIHNKRTPFPTDSETKVQKQVSGKIRIKVPRPEDPKCGS